MIELPAPLFERGQRRRKRAIGLLLAIGVAAAVITMVVVPKPPLPGDPMQPWLVALTLFVFVGVAPMLLVRLVSNKEAHVLAELRRTDRRCAGTVMSRQGSNVVVKWADDHGSHLARVAVPAGFATTEVEVVAANSSKIALVIDGALYLGVVL